MEKATQQFDVVVAGQLGLDLIPEIPLRKGADITDYFIPGKQILTGPLRLNLGGPVANAGIALAKLGLKTSLYATIGEDEIGKLIFILLQDKNCTLNLIPTKDIQSSYTIVISPPGIDRIYLHGPGANSFFSADELDQTVLANTRSFHFGYPPSVAKMFENGGKELVKMFKLAKSCGATTSLDMTLPEPDTPAGEAPWITIMEKVLPYVDIFLPSIEEVFYIFDRQKYLQIKQIAGNKEAIEFINPEDYPNLAEKAVQLGAKIVVLKTGYRGLYLRTGAFNANEFGKVKPGSLQNWSNRELWCPAFQVSKIASATGSGDSAIAGFLTAFMNGCSAEKALKYANCLGYQNLREYDGTKGVLNWQQTTALVDKGDLKLIDIPQLKGPDWRWNSELKIWHGRRDRL